MASSAVAAEIGRGESEIDIINWADLWGVPPCKESPSPPVVGQCIAYMIQIRSTAVLLRQPARAQATGVEACTHNRQRSLKGPKDGGVDTY